MPQASNKTNETDASVAAFLDGVAPDARRQDARALCELMQRVSGLAPKLWGASIVGFGSYHYRYESGREGDAPLVGFSPRKANLALYVLRQDRSDLYPDLLARLGPHTRGVSCLYLKRLADADLEVLEEIIRTSLC